MAQNENALGGDLVHTIPERKMHRKWIVAAAAIGINLTMGIGASWSIIQKTLVNDWHWSNVEASLPFMTYNVVVSLANVLSGKLQDKTGPRAAASLSGLFLGVGLIASSFIRTPLGLMISFGIFCAFGSSLSISTTTPTCLKWFSKKERGLVAGTVVGAWGLAAMYLAPLMNWLIVEYGTSRAFLVIGIFTSAAILFFAQFLSIPRSTGETGELLSADDNDPGHIDDAKGAPGDFTCTEMLKTPGFYKLWLMFSVTGMAAIMINVHIGSIAVTQANWQNGFYLVMIFALFNCIGRFGAGYLSDKYGRIRTLRFVFLLLCANLFLFITYTAPLTLMVGTAVTGLCHGSTFSLFPLITVDNYGLKNMGANYGLVMTGCGFGSLIGSVTGGFVADTTGSYHIAYIICAVCVLPALILTRSMSPPART